MELAIDVSKYQGGRKIIHMKNHIKGVVVRSSDGIGKDYLFKNSLLAHKDYPIAIYHYFRNNWNVSLQVQIVKEQRERAKQILGYYPKVVMDWEDDDGIKIVGRHTAIKRGYEFATHIEEITGEDTVLYTGKYKFENIFTPTMRIRYRSIYKYFTSKRLWFAWYFTNETLNKRELYEKLALIDSGFKPNKLPAGFDNFIMWQFGKTNYILEQKDPVDINVIYDNYLFEKGDEPPEPSPEDCPCEERVKALEDKVFS